MEEKHYLPKFLQALPQILWWELDELFFLAIPISIGILSNAQLYGAVAGFIVMKLYSKLKESKQPGFLKHWLYSKGLFGVKGKYPEYWVKEIVM